MVLPFQNSLHTVEERSFFQVNVPVHPWFLEEIEKREVPPLIPIQSEDEPVTIPVTIDLPDKQKEIAELIKKNLGYL